MRKRCVAFGLALLLLLLGGCTPPWETTLHTEYLFAMDTVMTLTAYGTKAEEGLKTVEADLKALEGRLSVTDASSEIWRINHSGGQPVSVSEDTAGLLALALELGERTEGDLDISVYPVVKAWGFTTDQYQVPDGDELEKLLDRVDYSAVYLDGQTVTLPDGMELDLGSIAKGYAGAKAAETLRAAGVRSALLNLGGNVQTVGERPDGSPWRVGVTDPSDPETNIGVIEVLADEALVTSGGYQRYFEEDGKTYWHILDPATGYPADSGLLSVTVIGEDGAVCDGLSTALFVMGADKASDYWRSWGGFEAVFITDSGEIMITEGLENRFTRSEKYADAPLAVVRTTP